MYPSIHQVHVELRQIASLHDVSPQGLIPRDVGARLPPKAGSGSGAGADENATGEYRWGTLTTLEQGPDRIWRDHRGCESGVDALRTQVMWSIGSGLFRTFDRRESRPLDQKYVYVFRSMTRDGQNPALIHVLHYKKGAFAFGDLSKAEAGAGDDVEQRPHREELLCLDAEILGAPTRDARDRRPSPLARPFHFFHLADHPLPPSGIDAVKRDLAWRAFRLYDPALLDYARDRGVAPRPFLQLLAEKQDLRLDTGILVLHLPDVLEEAERRAGVLSETLDALEVERERLTRDNHYALAKRLHGAIAGTDMAGDAPATAEHIAKAEVAVRRLSRNVVFAAGDLVRWIGSTEAQPILSRATLPDGRNGSANESHALLRSTGQGLPREVAMSGPSAFSAAIRDFDDAKELQSRMLNWAYLVTMRLPETPNGRAWLEDNLRRARQGTGLRADAGADVIFGDRGKGEQGGSGDTRGDYWESKENVGEAVPEALGLYLEVYAGSWAKRDREKALSSLADFVRAKYGVPLTFSTGQARQVLQSRERRNLKLARRALRDLKRSDETPLELLVIDQGNIKGVKFVRNAAQYLDAGVKAVNLCYAVQQAIEDRNDPRKWLAATDAILQAYVAVADSTGRLPQLERQFKRTFIGKEFRFRYPWMAIAAAGSEVVIAGSKLGTAESRGEEVAQETVLAGTVIVLFSYFLPISPWATGLRCLGLAVEAVGSYLAAYFAPLRAFARNCEFGKPNLVERKTDAAASAIRPEAGDWIDFPLDQLPADVDREIRILEKLLHRFEPQFDVLDGILRMRVELGSTSRVTSSSFFDVALHASMPGELGGDVVLHAGEGFDDEPLLLGQWVDLKSLRPPPSMRAYEPVDPSNPPNDALADALGIGPHCSIRLEGTVTLDLYGDGSVVVERKVSRKVQLRSST